MSSLHIYKHLVFIYAYYMHNIQTCQANLFCGIPTIPSVFHPYCKNEKNIINIPVSPCIVNEKSGKDIFDTTNQIFIQNGRNYETYITP